MTVVHTNSSKVADDSRDLPLLTEIEQQQLVAWNATQRDYPRVACVPQLVTSQALATPDAIALVVEEQMLNYYELNRRANQLAHHLSTLGVGPNVLVGLCVERSLDMVIGLLGILKAGGAYVPLDPSYPPDRLAFMIYDTQTSVLVTQNHLTLRLHTKDTQLICLDSDAAILAQQPNTNPPVSASVEDLAYVIYTSGSTGRPKGVQITHDSLLNLVFWHQRAFGVTSTDKATQLTSPAFDATGWELWPYLTCGAIVFLLNEEQRVDPMLCRDFLLDRRITISFLPTALAESVLALEWPSQTALRYLLTGADTLHHHPSPRLPFSLINNYGPTEATVVTTSGLVPAVAYAERTPTIGRPIDNMQIYILDEQLHKVTIGTPGELYIGGIGLAKGYLNRPELNTEKFISHPFSPEPGARLYRTGDLVRFLPDGQVDFLGRVDYQIKIRGYRIEPDEIISVLNVHPAVQTSMVLARDDTPGDKHLVAYVVLNQGMNASTNALQEWLAERLPDYMIPTIFVRLDTLPVTTNGKVDRAALPAPDASNILQREDTATPGTPIEERLVEIVAPLLDLEQVGIDDNFFLLGGNSMMGTQLIMRVAETFGIDLPLRTLFEMPTVRQLAAEIERLIVARVEAMSEVEVLGLLQ